MLVNILDGADPLEACTDDLRRYVEHLLGHRSPRPLPSATEPPPQFHGRARPRQPAPAQAAQSLPGTGLPPAAGYRAHPPHARAGRHAPRRGHRVDRRQHRPGLRRRRRDRQRPRPTRGIPYGHRTGQALTRYLRARARHPLATFTALGGSARWRPDRQPARSDARTPQRTGRHPPHPRTPVAAHRRRHVAGRIRRRREISHTGPESRDRRQAPSGSVRPRPRSWQPHE